MVFSDDLPAAQRACSATSIPLLPVTLLLVIWLLPSHARACSNAALCGDHIDAFFLPLIASSLTGAPAAGAATPVADMPVIIRPPRGHHHCPNQACQADGRKATGELSFFDQQPQQHLLRDDQAQLSLRIDDGAGNSGSGNTTGEFTGVLASWIEGDGRISGAFSGVAPDGAGGIGGVAVQLSGAPYVPLFGVEN